MPKRSWEELIADGRALLAADSDVKWAWGDLALEVEPMANSGVNTGSLGRLKKYAEEVGVSFESLVRYRSVAAAWPGRTRVLAAPWTVHRELAGAEDRFERIKSRERWTTDEARRSQGKLPRRQQVARARELLSDPEVARAAMTDPQIRHVVDEARPAEDRAEQARRLVRDPAVARHVVQDNTARSAMARAAQEMEKEAGERQRERAPGIVSMSDFYQATGELSRMRQSGMKSLDAMRKIDLSDDQRDSLKDDHGRVKLVSEWIDSYLESGDHSFDRELDALLREEL